MPSEASCSVVVDFSFLNCVADLTLNLALCILTLKTLFVVSVPNVYDCDRDKAPTPLSSVSAIPIGQLVCYGAE